MTSSNRNLVIVHDKATLSKGEQQAVAPSASGTSNSSTRQKFMYAAKQSILFLVGTVLLTANVFHIYSIATFLGDRAQCYICTNPQTYVPPFVWYTSWTLWLTTATCVVARFFPQNNSKRSFLNALFRTACPWSVTITITYSYYLATTSGGSNMVDEDLCRTVSDSAVPWTTTPAAAATAFLVLDRITNFTAHYGCGFINLTLFIIMVGNDNDDSGGFDYGVLIPYLPFGLFLVLSIVIALVHTYVDDVYCTDTIWFDVLMSDVIFLVVHAILCLVHYRRRTRGGGEGELAAEKSAEDVSPESELEEKYHEKTPYGTVTETNEGN